MKLGAILDFLPRKTRAVLTKPAFRKRQEATPGPIAISPSQDFDGNDGPWSSFPIRVGTPEQDVKVFISTSGQESWVVLPAGCTNTDPSNCKLSRGNLFNISASSTWVDNGLYRLDDESNLNYNGNGDYGFDTVGLGWQGAGGPTLNHQIVAGIATKDFYLGTFGISPRPTNFTNFDSPQPSYLTSLKNKTLIPSLSYGYTAGAPYRLKKVQASLTLGGYDSSRFVPNNVSFTLADVTYRDIVVNVQSVRANVNGQVKPLLSENILSFVDGGTPQIWLPLQACQAFEDAFDLTYDPTTELYLVNDSLHDTLTSQNPTFHFTLSNNPGTGPTIDISLPYASFDLQVGYPLVSSTTRYFPLRRAANESQYTLGRTFLQEAYLTVNYERGNFSISQCLFDPNAQQNLVAIAPGNGTTGPTSHNNHKISGGAIAGIVIGALVVLLLAGATLLFARRRSRIRKAKLLEEEKAQNATDEKDASTLLELPTQDNKPEMPGSPPLGNELPTEDNRPEMMGSPVPRTEMPGDENHPAEVEGDGAIAAELSSGQDHAAELPAEHSRHELQG